MKNTTSNKVSTTFAKFNTKDECLSCFGGLRVRIVYVNGSQAGSTDPCGFVRKFQGVRETFFGFSSYGLSLFFSATNSSPDILQADLPFEWFAFFLFYPCYFP